MESEKKIKWGVERRLEFIEFRLFWEGGVRRGDIMTTFQVSEPQASKDLTLYQERAPGNAVYDKVSRRYVAGPGFTPAFLTEGPTEYLMRLRLLGEGALPARETWLGSPPEVDIVLNPARQVEGACLQALLGAVREKQSLEILYQSMSRAEPAWRRITPHAFGFDGFRWHARGYCHAAALFKDFLIPRVTDTRNFEAPGPGGEDDTMWNERFDIVIGPHPGLTSSQRAAVERDYSMEDGTKRLEVRFAMLYYVLRRLGLLDEPEKKSPRKQHIVVVNVAKTAEAMRRADWAEGN